MAREIIISDFLGDEWKIHLPPRSIDRNRKGMFEMWVGVSHAIPELGSYWQIPLPVFTEWWDDQS